jgi:hypothetical protein
MDPTGWPMLVGEYMGVAKAGSTNQAKVYLCPSEKGIADNWVIQLHFQGNRYILSDLYERDTAIRSVMMTKGTSMYWMTMEKGPWDFANVRPGGLANPVLLTWNSPPRFAAVSATQWRDDRHGRRRPRRMAPHAALSTRPAPAAELE